MNILISSVIDVNRVANNRLHQFIAHLSENHSITVVCPKDNWRDSEFEVEKYGANESMSGSNVNCVYLSNSSLPISPTVQEVFSEVALALETEIDYSRFDIHLDYNTLFIGHAIGRRVRKYNIPTVYDLADDLPAMIRESPQIPDLIAPVASKVGERIIQRKFGNAERVTYITEGLRQELEIPEPLGIRIPNGVPIESFTHEENGIKIEGLDVDFTIGYVGVTREWVDLGLLVEAAARLRESGINAGVVIVGDEGGIDDAKQLVEQLEIEEYCHFVGTIPYESVPDYINSFDVGTIPFKKGEIAENSLPLKLFEYMACEVPVVSSSIPGVKDSAGDIVRFADSVCEWEEELRVLAKDPDLRREYGHDGRQLVEESYSWEALTAEMETLITDISYVQNENLRGEA